MELADVTTAIANAGAGWVAAETEIALLVSDGLPRNVFGLAITDARREELIARAAELEEQSSLLADAGPPPVAFDWRTSRMMTPVRSQGTCGSCVAFAACATLEARARIHVGADERFDLSEAHLFACGNSLGCTGGWDPELALTAARRGIGSEAAFPYLPQDQACRTVAPILSVPGWTAFNTAEAQKRAIASNGPMMGGMLTFEDLAYYRSGIYEHVAGAPTDPHMVCVVGYDDTGGYWIVKNSWGTDWGEDGYLRIKYGEGRLGSETPFYDPDIALTK